MPPVPPVDAPDEHDDDKPVGRLLSRREMIALLGGTGSALFAVTCLGKLNFPMLATTPTATVTPLPSCVVRPALTEGPYFVEEMLNRSDIRVEPSDGSIKEGLPLKLVFKVSDVSDSTCKPLEGAQVDVWHCDAQGVYSDVQDRSFDTTGLKFLRGYQVTDENGMAEFLTIYPGWYSGRTVHIHFKIRTDPDSDTGYEFTSQLFFDDDLTDKVYENPPYAAKGQRNTLNSSDNIFQGSEGLLTLNPTLVADDESIVEDTPGGYIAVFDIGLDLSEPAPTESGSFGGRPGGGQPPRGTPPGGGPGGQPPATPSA